jgi:hypothetical protein
VFSPQYTFLLSLFLNAHLIFKPQFLPFPVSSACVQICQELVGPHGEVRRGSELQHAEVRCMATDLVALEPLQARLLSPLFPVATGVDGHSVVTLEPFP